MDFKQGIKAQLVSQGQVGRKGFLREQGNNEKDRRSSKQPCFKNLVGRHDEILAKGWNRYGFADSLQVCIAAEKPGGLGQYTDSPGSGLCILLCFCQRIEIHGDDAFGR
ncbi:hypothetical protein SDC9_186314 [bioreactor metagenome]|uniref:Uncharacterized protein n=1 Tax=bioreactor metagenome TaxID=1076179 RepID=A0A645HKP7_9ZZZZ